jgi:hypothetical protein
MKKKTWIASLLVFALLLALLSGCRGKETLKRGTYHAENLMATLTLAENNEFILFGPPQISFAPSGEYSVQDGKVYLTLSTGIEGEGGYVFSIGDDMLVFEEGAWLENWLEPGAILYLVE